jgi:hypothetical protein
MMHFFKEFLDALNTDGGHMVLALGLLLLGLVCVARWNIAEGKELFIFAMGVLGMAMKSSGKANGVK